MSEKEADEVMEWVEHMAINPGWPEYEAMLNHLYAMHKLRDEDFYHSTLVGWDWSLAEYVAFKEMQTF